MKLQMQKISQSAVPQPILTPSEASGPTGGQVFAKGEVAEEKTETAAADDPISTIPRFASRSRGNSLQQGRPLLGSRNPSTNTITQSRAGAPSSPSKLGKSPSRGQLDSSPRQGQPAAREIPSYLSNRPRSTRSLSDDSSDSTSSDDAAGRSGLGRSQMFRRAPKYSAARVGKQRATHASNETDEDEEATFFTFSKPEEQERQDLGATLRHPNNQQNVSRQPIEITKITSAGNTDSSVSSAASSAAPVTSSRGTIASNDRRPGPLSPRQRAQLVGATPQGGRAEGRSGSEGTPSMGSSFSDLDGKAFT